MNNENNINLDDYLINKKYGIINKLINVDSLDGMPKIYRIKAHKENIYNVKYFQDNNNDGYGYNFSYIKAKQSAIGEAIERYCSSYIPSNLLIDTYNNMKKNANTIDPNLIIHKVSKYKKIDGNAINDSIIEVMFKSKILNKMKKNNLQECLKCNLKEQCKGGCQGIPFAYFGKLMEHPDPQCWVAYNELPQENGEISMIKYNDKQGYYEFDEINTNFENLYLNNKI